MIDAIKRLPEAIQEVGHYLRALVEVLTAIHDSLQVDGPTTDRLEDVERRMRLLEADMEATLQKAESRYKAARSAEERSRTMERHAEEIQEAVGFSEEGEEEIPEEYLQLLRERDGAGSPEEGMQPLPPGMEHDSQGYRAPRDTAKDLKWGRI